MFFKVAWIDLNGPQEIRDWDFADLHISLVSSLAAALRALLLLPLATAGLAVRACVRTDVAARRWREEPHVTSQGTSGSGRVLAYEAPAGWATGTYSPTATSRSR